MEGEYNEQDIAQYFVTGLIATLAGSGLNWLTALVEVKKLLDVEIDKALDRWAEELNSEDFEDDA